MALVEFPLHMIAVGNIQLVLVIILGDKLLNTTLLLQGTVLLVQGSHDSLVQP